MVTDMDDDGVEITKQDGTHRADPRRHQGLGRRDPGRRAGADRSPSAAGAETDKAGRVVVEPRLLAARPSRGLRRGRPDGARTTCPAWPRWPCSRVPTPPAPSCGACGGKPSQAVPLPRPRDARRDLALHAPWPRSARSGSGGFIGWLLWLVVHITFLTGFKNRFGALTRWAVSFVGRGRYERALTGRWVRPGEATRPQSA